jgi:hypothetical protein
MGAIDYAASAMKAAITKAITQKRVRADITVREFYGTVVAVFMIGALFGWGAFGELPFPKDALEKSSLADFLAAAGTWIIGWGAWKYARAGHQHQVDAASRSDQTRLKLDILRVGLVTNKMLLASGVHGAIESLKQDDYNVGHGAAFYALARCKRRLERMTLTESEKEALSDEHLKMLRTVEHHIESALARADNVSLLIDAKSSEPVDEPLIEELKSTFNRTSELNDVTKQFVTELAKHRRRLNAWLGTEDDTDHS